MEWLRDRLFARRIRILLRAPGGEILRADLHRDERFGLTLDVVVRVRGDLYEQIIYVGQPMKDRAHERQVIERGLLQFVAQILAALAMQAPRRSVG